MLLENIQVRVAKNMESQNISEGLAGIDWPSKESYFLSKFEYKQSISDVANDLIRRSRFMADLSEREKLVAVSLISDFMWGLEITERLFKHKDFKPVIKIMPDDRVTVAAFDLTSPYWRPRFIINSDTLKTISRTLASSNSIELGEPPHINGVKPDEAYEISGVEEKAHRFFAKIKGVGKAFTFSSLAKDPVIRHSSDIEERALIWKSEYTKHYFPKLHDQYHNLLRLVQGKRSNL